jgi:hypothetical protein
MPQHREWQEVQIAADASEIICEVAATLDHVAKSGVGRGNRHDFASHDSLPERFPQS